MKKAFLKYVLNLLSRIPISIAYFIADFLYIIQIYLVKYRKKVVLDNLRNSFPEKDQKEIIDIYKKFNRHLCDYVIESIISTRFSSEEISELTSVENLEIIEKIKQKNQNIIFFAGHIFNWEYCVEIAKHLPIKNIYAIYKPVHDEIINDFIKKSRAKNNVSPISMKESFKKMLLAPNNGDTAFFLVADQSPFWEDIRYELNFLNQQTPVYHGFDKMIFKKNYAPIYINIEKTSRGKYKFRLEELSPKADKWEKEESIHAFFDALEKNIKKAPSNWLWSHRRWKYKKDSHY